MKNFIAIGNSLTLPAGAVGVGEAIIEGQAYNASGFFGIAASSTSGLDDNEEFVLNLTGVYDLPKAPTQDWLIGEPIYWDHEERRCTSIETDNILIGRAVLPVGVGAGETIGRVRLHGVAV